MLDNYCYYCGKVCSDKYHIKDFVKKTFTNVDIVCYPGSKYICEECYYFFNSNSEIIMIDGEKRIGPPRLYSWIITNDKKIAATKKHIKELRDIVLNPPELPFRIILSDSGKKNLVFRAKLARIKNNYPVQFEEEIVYVNIEELKNRLLLADKLSAAIGKIAILNCDEISYAITIYNYYNNLNDYEKWLKIYRQPLSRLASWLAKNKECASNEYKQINN